MTHQYNEALIEFSGGTIVPPVLKVAHTLGVYWR